MRQMVASALAGLLTAVLPGCEDQRPESDFVPQARACHRTADRGTTPGEYAPVPCSVPHTAETFMVGHFTGPDAELSAPPDDESEAIFGAYHACDTEALSFLGGDWRESRLALTVLVPSEESWSAGERWYRCDLSEMLALDAWEPTSRANSLMSALKGASPLRYGCFNEPTIEAGEIRTIPPASCTGPHDTEFVGAWRAYDTPDGEMVTEDDMDAGCLETGAAYVGVSERDLEQRMQVHTVIPGEPAWHAGIPGALCFVQIREGSLTRSLHGTGLRGLRARV